MTETFSYDVLREWHLARLRNLASKDAQRVAATPASLIAFDKEAIKSLVADAAHAIPVKSHKQPIAGLVLAGTWILTQIVFAGLLIAGKTQPADGLHSYFDCTVAALYSYGQQLSTASVPEKLAFLSFYLLPVLLTSLAPGSSIPGELIRFLEKKVGNKSLRILDVLTFVIGMLLAVGITLLCLTFQSAPPGPESLSLVDAGTADLPARQVIAWGAIGMAAAIFLGKAAGRGRDELESEATSILKDLATDAENSTKTSGSSVSNLRQLLKELQQREHAIADFSSQVLMCVSDELLIQSVSPSVLIHWGHFSHDLIGKELSTIVFLDDHDIFFQTISNSPKSKSFDTVCRVRRSDNSIVDCEWHIEWSPRYNRYFVSCTDVTDRMNLERTRRSFTAQLTHDMRSPLSAVNLTLSAMQESTFGALSAEANRLISRSRVSLTRVLDLINEILEAEKLRSRQQKLSLQTFKVKEIFEPLVDELNAVAHERNVKFVTTGGDLEVRADKNLVSRVFSNIMSNAVSFSPKGGVVEVECSQATDSILVRIKDQGPGIPKDYQQLIFERFGLAKRRDQSDRVSTGLGLSICRDIIIAHGGMIGVDSEEGRGSTFWFTLTKDRKAVTREAQILPDQREREEPTAAS